MSQWTKPYYGVQHLTINATEHATVEAYPSFATVARYSWSTHRWSGERTLYGPNAAARARAIAEAWKENEGRAVAGAGGRIVR